MQEITPDQGGEGAMTAEAALAEIRAIFAAFDWEHDDRQLALEAIERITDGAR